MAVSLPHILLALIADRPASGYALKKRIDTEIAPLWSAELSQIYPTLARLQRAGFLSGRAMGPGRGPGSYRLAATRAGRRELVRWLSEPPRPPTLHDEALARAVVASAYAEERGEIVRLYERMLADEQARLRGKNAAGPLAAAARDAALAHVEGLRRWARARQGKNDRSAPPAGPPPRSRSRKRPADGEARSRKGPRPSGG